MNVIQKINDFLWGPGTIVLIFGTGLFFTVKLKFIQFQNPLKILRATFFSKDIKNSDKRKGLSNFQALSTVLAASMGTGNIIGVAGAIAAGGPGAVFWMWVSAVFSMATGYAENVLGVKYKNITPKSRARGPMLYLEYGLKSKAMAVIFAVGCVLASFGIGNMAQSNAISQSMAFFGVKPAVAGLITLICVSIIILRKGNASAKAAEKIIPAVSVFYIIGSLIVLFKFRSEITDVFILIVKSAFGFAPVAGGVVGYTIKSAVTIGLQRGIFSNEAGMGSSVIIHTSAECNEPCVMGLWAIAEVFIDTVLCCTLTAFVIISTGGHLAGESGIKSVINAFEKGLGNYAGIFVAVSTMIFAFATILGWCCYGAECVKYLSKKQGALTLYKYLFLAAVLLGSVLNLMAVWELSDIFNALMLIPNLIGILFFSNQIAECTRDYYDKSHSYPLKNRFQ